MLGYQVIIITCHRCGGEPRGKAICYAIMRACVKLLKSLTVLAGSNIFSTDFFLDARKERKSLFRIFYVYYMVKQRQSYVFLGMDFLKTTEDSRRIGFLAFYPSGAR